MIYLDHNATTPVAPEVRDAILPCLEGSFGNPSSVHTTGMRARAMVEGARAEVAALIGATPDRLLFTSSGTEADNLAIKGAAHRYREKGRHLITSVVEHPAVYNSCKALEEEGFEVTYLPVTTDGETRYEDLAAAIRPDTILISLMQANNETGVISPIRRFADLAHSKGILFHTDAVQALGKLPVDVAALGVDLLTISGHKIYAPKGIGAIWAAPGVELTPMIHGGHQELQIRPGTENVPGIVGFGAAARLVGPTIASEAVRLTALRDSLQSAIEKKIDLALINAKNAANRSPNTLSVSFKYIEGEAVILSLDLMGIAVSTGSACSSGVEDERSILAQCGLPPEISRGTIRFSFGKYTTEAEIDTVIEKLPPIIERFKMMSPLIPRT